MKEKTKKNLIFTLFVIILLLAAAGLGDLIAEILKLIIKTRDS